MSRRTGRATTSLTPAHTPAVCDDATNGARGEAVFQMLRTWTWARVPFGPTRRRQDAVDVPVSSGPPAPPRVAPPPPACEPAPTSRHRLDLAPARRSRCTLRRSWPAGKRCGALVRRASLRWTSGNLVADAGGLSTPALTCGDAALSQVRAMIDDLGWGRLIVRKY